jgi:hypothetical protein
MTAKGPTLSEIERIAALPDKVIRNLQITQCYHELALVLKERTPENANWCTFATWASKQAGQTIRQEDLRRTLDANLGPGAELQQAARDLSEAARKLGATLGVEEILELIWKAYQPEAAFERSSDAVARGNLKVFAEIGREFARFHASCFPDPVYDSDNIARFCESLRPGEPPEGQRNLSRAFRHYYQALFEEDRKARSELMLLGNLEIGFHEQTRLQSEINEALAAPLLSPDIFAQNMIEVLQPGGGRFNQLIWLFMRLLGRLAALDQAIATSFALAQRETQFLITETMMTIEIPPPNRLRLGDDLAAGFPPILEQITNPELQALLAQIDPAQDGTRGSGAKYWGDLPERMHFIAELFRCYQVSEPLFEPPFSPEQEAALKEGRLPPGSL